MVTRRIAVWVALLALGLPLAVSLLPRVAGYHTVVVHSGSMGRVAPVGSVAIGRMVRAARIHEGDIILVRRQVDGRLNTPVLHRVVSLQHRDGEVIVVTKGDANTHAERDPAVLPGRIMVLRYAVPYVGYVVAYVGSPFGWLFLGAAAGFVLLARCLKTLWAVDEERPTTSRRPAHGRPAA